MANKQFLIMANNIPQDKIYEHNRISSIIFPIDILNQWLKYSA